ncbi:uncharacterized protein LOC129917956 [Episyrphus balteatus]|uniref:uncharacterized protein LOC129917956 n=1 Tax=Episyrphus balteatus TaxID=286459 RepID=UPI002486A9ED|nr:uncharacterized protein LOC129917956 [Episyrphus balteatus]
MEELAEMHDINFLIQLEAYKRFKEDEQQIRPFVEDKIRQYNDTRNEYLNLYSKYVDLIKSSASRNALQSEQLQILHGNEQTEASMKTIAQETNIDKQDEFFTTDDVATTKKIIAETPNFENLVEQSFSSENNKNRVDFIQSSLMRVERNLESSVVSGFDSLLKRIEM